ncbi:hypothetical protein POVCU2_0046930 [Plasmodium ovale curtisi]|uniref:Uncharacterized protein n=1 Tax=Plasmodium ovale curtisi TaxID=864141 RepID=A0A1A8W5Y5_PLAOA|nr:hypothetical protein POVCU2_0046930 [Plasmodium ovale curtisi]
MRLKFYTSCSGTGQVKWELLGVLTIINSLLLLFNVNYKENISFLNNKKSENSDINDDLINVDMNEFSNNEKDESSDDSEREKKYNKLKIRYLYSINSFYISNYIKLNIEFSTRKKKLLFFLNYGYQILLYSSFQLSSV